MRSLPSKIILTVVAGLLATVASGLRVSGAQIVTNWVAFNDHHPGPLPTAKTWGTGKWVTGWDMRIGPGGTLSNALNGQSLPVSLAVAANGAPDDFPTVFYPYANTPSSNLFFGYVDISNTGSGIGVRYSANSYVTLTFSGLNPNKHYVFRGTSTRGGSYPLRWTVATISGAGGFVDAQTSGVLTSNDFAADLVAGQAAYNSGDNRAGDVVGWDFITPSPDGTFSVQSSNYVGHIKGGGTADNNIYGYAIDGFLLAEVEAAPPAIVSQPVSDVTVEQNRPFNLSVAGTGTPLFYKWYKQGSGQIAGATFSTYSVARAALSDAGTYYAVVYNPLGNVTSTVARVSVNADVTAPSASSVYSYPNVDSLTLAASQDQLIIEFSEIVDPVTASAAANYTLSSGGHPLAVVLTNETTVALTLATALNDDADYTVSISNVKDLVGNVIATGGNNPAPFHSWLRSPGNGLLFEVYNTGPGVDVVGLTGSPVFPSSPSFTTNLYAFDSRVAFPDDSNDNYGSRVRGVFIPPVSGDWIFFLRAYDRAELYLNPDGLDPAGKQILVAEVTGNNPRDWNKLLSSPVHLRGGKPYYIETLQKADTGIDATKVAARLVGTGLPTLGVDIASFDTNALAGASICYPYAPRDLGGPVTILQDLTNITVEANHVATFAFKLSNADVLPTAYHWYRDGGLITSNAYAATYSFSPTLADDGAQFRVDALRIGSKASSATVTLHVVPDHTPPTVVGASATDPSLTNIVVQFSEPMIEGDVVDIFNYTIPNVQIDAVVLNADGASVTISFTDPLVLNQSYSVTVNSGRDLAENFMSPAPETVIFVAGGVPPQLSITQVGAQATIAWPASATGFTLEQTDALQGGTTVWTAVSGTPVVVNNQNTVTVTIGSDTKFYRLRQ